MRLLIKLMLIQNERDVIIYTRRETAVEETTGNNEMHKDKMWRFINKIDVRFSYQNTKIFAAVSAP